MTLYILVIGFNYEEAFFASVFDTKELAEKAQAEYFESNYYSQYMNSKIFESELNPVTMDIV